MKVQYTIFAIFISILTTSCVSLKKFKDLDADYLSANKANELLSQENRDLDIVNMELNENVLR